MSSPRFAAITAGLLARKGEAQPWAEPDKRPLPWDGPLDGLPRRYEPPPAEPRVSFSPMTEAPKPRAPEPVRVVARPTAPAPKACADTHGESASDAHTGEQKKCSVRMSHHDYERLGILAVKQGKSRQRLLQEAVDRMLCGITQAFAGGCACLREEP